MLFSQLAHFIINSRLTNILDVINLLATIIEVGGVCFILIFGLIHCLIKETRLYRQLQIEMPDAIHDIRRKFKIARMKYILMIVICVLEIVIGIGLALPNSEQSIKFLLNSNSTENKTNPCSLETLFNILEANYVGRGIYSLVMIMFLGLLFSLRSLSVVSNNIYIERKEISNFKSWINIFLVKIFFILVLSLFSQTLILELIISLIFLFHEYCLLVKAVKNLRQSLKLRYYEVKRDYPNSSLVAKSYRDSKLFSLTSKFALAFIFSYLISIILWVHTEAFFTLIFNFPCYMNQIFGYNIEPHTFVAVSTSEFVYQVVHVLQNIALFVGNMLLLLLYGIVILPRILKLCFRCCCKRNSYSGSYRVEMMTPFLRGYYKEIC